MYNVQGCTIYNVHCTMYKVVQCTMYIINCSLPRTEDQLFDMLYNKINDHRNVCRCLISYIPNYYSFLI